MSGRVGRAYLAITFSVISVVLDGAAKEEVLEPSSRFTSTDLIGAILGGLPVAQVADSSRCHITAIGSVSDNVAGKSMAKFMSNSYTEYELEVLVSQKKDLSVPSPLLSIAALF